MSHSRTGSFPIGFRRLNSDWQKSLPAVIDFAKSNGFESLDTGPLSPEDLKSITSAGLRIGSVDLLQPWTDLASPDPAKRKRAARANADYIHSVTSLDVRNFFVIVIPENPAAKRHENLVYAADGFNQLCNLIADTPAKISVEGWPGRAPEYPALACTPESYRALFATVPSPIMSVNFDPSHLVRTGIDPIRFLKEFASRIVHVHAKDTELNSEALYQFGNLQPATLESNKPHAWGAHHWRYTLPGKGQSNWPELLKLLKQFGYKGVLSIELEDEDFNGTESGEKRGLLASRDYLVRT